ncbi:MAG: CHAP domain-containing protein [Conexibacter sp.]
MNYRSIVRCVQLLTLGLLLAGASALPAQAAQRLDASLGAHSTGLSELRLSLTVATRPHEACTGTVAAGGRRASLPAARGKRRVGWRWTVTAGAPSGAWRFAVACRSSSGTRRTHLRSLVLVPAGPAANGLIAPGTLSVAAGRYVHPPHPQGGKGSGSGGNPGYPGYCTYGAWEQAPWLGRAVHGNAREWYAAAAAAGLPVGDVPVVGAVFVKVAGTFGHVGIVTGIRDAHSFTTLEMNGGAVWVNQSRGITNEFGVYREHVQYTGPAMKFIYRPGTQPQPAPAPAPAPTPAPAPQPSPTPAPAPAQHIFHIHNTCRDGACGLRVRSGPSTSAAQIGLVYDGDAVNIRCQTVGTMVTGGEGSNDVWDQIDWAGGVGYVADLYVDTPGGDTPQPHRHFTPGIPRC